MCVYASNESLDDLWMSMILNLNPMIPSSAKLQELFQAKNKKEDETLEENTKR